MLLAARIGIANQGWNSIKIKIFMVRIPKLLPSPLKELRSNDKIHNLPKAKQTDVSCFVSCKLVNVLAFFRGPSCKKKFC